MDSATATAPAQELGQDELKAGETIERDALLDFFAAVPTDIAAELGVAHAMIDGIGVLACRSIPITELNRAMAAGIADPAAGGIEDALAWLDGHAAPGWTLQRVPIATSPAIDDAIERHDLMRTGAGWAKFVRPVTPDAAALAPGDVRIVEAADAELFARTVQTGMEMPPVFVPWFAALVGRPGWHCALAMRGDEAQGGALLYARDGVAWAGTAGVIPAHRRQGVQRRMVAARIATAAEHGVRLISSETGQPGADDEPGFSSYRNQLGGGFRYAYNRANYKRG